MPLFSVIVPVYNRADLIGESISSVLAQENGDFELILVDDGSTDRSVEIIREWMSRDARIRLEVLPHNQGRCAARNKGLELATAPWICYLDSDDLYYPNHLSTLHALILAHPDISAFATDQSINGKLKEYGSSRFTADSLLLELRDFIRYNPISPNQLCHSSDLQQRWPERRIDLSEDWLFVRQLAFRTPILKKAIVTNLVREHAERSMNTASAERFVHYNLMAAEEFLQNSLPASLERELRSHTLLLCANVLLSAGKKKLAWPLFRKSMRYGVTWRHPLFYKGWIKFLLP